MFPKLLLPILILIPLAVLALVFLPPSSPPIPDPLAPPAASSAVTVSAEYLPARSSADFIIFRVSLNTHSIDLDDINFQKSVVLEKSGQKFSPVEVTANGSGLPAEASAKAGHHLSAEVKFSRAVPPFKIVFLETPEVNRQEFEFNVIASD